MQEIYVKEGELEYYINPTSVVNEPTAPYKSQLSFEEESKDCITLEEFSKGIGEAIKQLIPNGFTI